VYTRVATTDDLPVLLDLWDELRQVGGRAERAVNPVTAVDVRERMLAVLTDPECRIALACDGDTPAGMVVLRVTGPDPLSEALLAHIVHLVVSRGSRHRGVGHALLAAAADFAAERHLDHVAASVYPSLRDASRFFARMGFAPVAVRRVAPLAVLRRRLGTDGGLPVNGDTVRRRSRLPRPVPSQRGRRSGTDRVK
jgi:ribosomal protein S18 acetylase RimI-like enzyme